MCKHKAYHAARLLEAVMDTFPNQEEAILGLTAMTTMLLTSLTKEKREEIFNGGKIEKYQEELSAELSAKLDGIFDKIVSQMKPDAGRGKERFDSSEMMSVEDLTRMFATKPSGARH